MAVEELEVDDRVAAVEAGRLTEGVDEKVAEGVDERIEQFVGGCIPVLPLINSIILEIVMCNKLFRARHTHLYSDANAEKRVYGSRTF